MIWVVNTSNNNVISNTKSGESCNNKKKKAILKLIVSSPVANLSIKVKPASTETFGATFTHPENKRQNISSLSHAYCLTYYLPELKKKI